MNAQYVNSQQLLIKRFHITHNNDLNHLIFLQNVYKKNIFSINFMIFFNND